MNRIFEFSEFKLVLYGLKFGLVWIKVWICIYRILVLY